MDNNDEKDYGRSWGNVQFTQGNKSPELLKKGKANYIAQFLRDQLQLKNVSFLLGSGTSSPALPLMSGLYAGVMKEIEKHPTSLQSSLFSKVSAKAQGNLEEILGLLYARLSYYLGIEKDKDETKEYGATKSLIKQIEKYILAQLSQSISDQCSEKMNPKEDCFISTQG